MPGSLSSASTVSRHSLGWPVVASPLQQHRQQPLQAPGSGVSGLGMFGSGSFARTSALPAGSTASYTHLSGLNHPLSGMGSLQSPSLVSTAGGVVLQGFAPTVGVVGAGANNTDSGPSSRPSWKFDDDEFEEIMRNIQA